jgi:hypothetical protein
MENLFKFVFFSAVAVFWFMGVGFFLLAVKLTLVFTPQVKLFGMIISY